MLEWRVNEVGVNNVCVTLNWKPLRTEAFDAPRFENAREFVNGVALQYKQSGVKLAQPSIQVREWLKKKLHAVGTHTARAASG